jgi:hypothetical protein
MGNINTIPEEFWKCMILLLSEKKTYHHRITITGFAGFIIFADKTSHWVQKDKKIHIIY